MERTSTNVFTRLTAAIAGAILMTRSLATAGPAADVSRTNRVDGILIRFFRK